MFQPDEITAIVSHAQSALPADKRIGILTTWDTQNGLRAAVVARSAGGAITFVTEAEYHGSEQLDHALPPVAGGAALSIALAVSL